MSTYHTVRGAAAATAILMTSSAAFADVSAQQVWDDWQAYLGGFGYEVSATESATSDGLKVSDLRMTFPVPEEEVTMVMTMQEMTFSDNGDGTVSIDLPAQMPITIGADGSDAFEVGLDYTTTGWSMVVSGDADAMSYTYSAASIGVALANVMAEGQSVDVGTAMMEMTKVSGNSDMTLGDVRTSTQKILTGPITYAFDITDPDNADTRFVINGQTDSLEMDADVAIPKDVDMTDMAAAMRAGFAVDGGYTFGPGNMSLDASERGEATQVKTNSDGGEFSVAMDQSGISYAIGSNNLEMEMAGGDIPFPVSMTMAELGLNLQMPVSKSDEEQEFGLGLLLGDFTMSDLIWGIFDPAAQLPRDPATIALDATGTAKLFTDLMDPEQVATTAMPGELNTLSLNNLIVSLVGAELTGDGNFVFDNSDTVSFDGFPKPVGEVNLGLAGGNALLDKLVAMGFVPEDQAMGARMMVGLFAVPGDGEDTLKSKIEFTEDGQIKANGQRLK